MSGTNTFIFAGFALVLAVLIVVLLFKKADSLSTFSGGVLVSVFSILLAFAVVSPLTADNSLRVNAVKHLESEAGVVIADIPFNLVSGCVKRGQKSGEIMWFDKETEQSHSGLLVCELLSKSERKMKLTLSPVTLESVPTDSDFESNSL